MKKVLVTGDISVDHNIYKGGRRYQQDSELLGSEIRSSIGGFYLLYELLSRFYEDNPEEQVTVVAGIERPKLDEVAEARHGYASWKPFKQKNGLTTACGKTISKQSIFSLKYVDHFFCIVANPSAPYSNCCTVQELESTSNCISELSTKPFISASAVE